MCQYVIPYVNPRRVDGWKEEEDEDEEDESILKIKHARRFIPRWDQRDRHGNQQRGPTCRITAKITPSIPSDGREGLLFAVVKSLARLRLAGARS